MKKKILPVFIVLAIALCIVSLLKVGAEGKKKPGDFVERVGVLFAEEIKMIYVEGGTFTLGWTAKEGKPPPYTEPVENVSVSSFYISETEVTENLWRAVMGQEPADSNFANYPKTMIDFYEVQEFLGRLYVLTGKVYRLPTEAEWEFAAKGGKPGLAAGHQEYLFAGGDIEEEVAVFGGFRPEPVKSRKPNILGIYDMSGNVEEWVWNAWSSNHVGGVDPVGIDSPVHAQRTRRGGTFTGESFTRYATARQIRSIEGSDPGLGFRIALSADQTSVPPGMVIPREIRRPVVDERAVPNTYRDPRWVTGDEYVWDGDIMGLGGATIKVWETGEIVVRPHNPFEGTIAGQWYTVNNIGLILVPNDGGERITIPYIFMAPEMVVVMNDRRNAFMAPTGRYHKVLESTLSKGTIAKPVVPDLVPTEEIKAGVKLAAANHQLWDMDNIPEEARGQDPRLIDGPDHGWWMGFGAGGEHTYRQDFDPDGQFRFSVYTPGQWNNILARGEWFTVNDMLLRVIGPDGRTNDFLYVVADTPVYPLRHLSFQDYERGDSRLFTRYPNQFVFGHDYEIPIGNPVLMGNTTFRQAPPSPRPCPGIPGKGSCGNTIYDCTCPVKP
ncbi:MAG: formylglycine-generating enzyme family protein [Firmicutes bacterium]|nr:formylglycine-generating enzyme family protein [Bacillota bacterium]